MFGVAAILGPLLGGWLTDNVSWHWIFYVNLPIGAVVLYIIYRYLPSIHGERPERKLDYRGAVVFTVAVTLLLLGLTNKQSSDWASVEVGGDLLIAAVVGAIFLWIESRAAEPIVPLDLFRNRSYAVTILATFLAAIGFFGAIIFLPRWFQFVKGVSPTDSGLQTLALLAGLILSSIALGHPRQPHRPLQVARHRCAGDHDPRHLPAHGPHVSHRPADDVGVDVHHRLRHRPDAVGVHDRHPERRALRPPRRRDRQPDLLPPDRRLGRPRRSWARSSPRASPRDSSPRWRPPASLRRSPARSRAFAASGAGGDITQVGGASLSDQLSQVPAFQGFVDAIVSGIHEAFSLAIADTFWFALATTVIALAVVVVGLREVPLRGFSQTPAADGAVAEGAAARRRGWPPRRGPGARQGLDQRGRREPAPDPLGRR